MAHFYLSDGVGVAEVGSTVALAGDEARHAAAVARLRAGERVVVGDGAGRVALAEATLVTRERIDLRVLELTVHPPLAPRITLVQALAKGGRDELAIQAATELGVAAVAPWAAARSVTRWSGAKVEAGAARWAAIVREAGKQAMRPWSVAALPMLSTEALAEGVPARRTLVLDPQGGTRIVDAVESGFRGDLVLVVGPEGGIAPDELGRLTEAGAVRVRLGVEILRTSTAAPAALAALAPHLNLWP